MFTNYKPKIIPFPNSSPNITPLIPKYSGSGFAVPTTDFDKSSEDFRREYEHAIASLGISHLARYRRWANIVFFHEIREWVRVPLIPDQNFNISPEDFRREY